MIEYTKFNYSPLGKALRKQIKSVKHHGRKPVEARKILKPAEQKKTKSIKYIFPKNQQSNNIKKELNQIKKAGDQIDRNNLVYEKIHMYLIFNNLKQ